MRRLVGVVVVLLALLVGLDRVAVVYAQSRVAANIRVSQRLSQTPHVTIHGFPFLTQLFGGTYNDVEASLNAVHRGSLTLTRIDVHLHRAQVPFGDVISNNVKRVPVERIDGTVTIGYADLATAGQSGLTLRYDGKGGVRVAGTVRVGGASIGADATGRIVVEGRRITVTVDNVTVGGQPAPAAVALAVRQTFSFSVALPTLPFGIELRSVRATPGGIVVTAVGTGITLRASPGTVG
jgi:hypothetical protein